MAMKDNTNEYQSNQSLDSELSTENLYNVGEKRLLLHKSGSGGPAVVFCQLLVWSDSII